MENPLISVVLPIYNVDKYLGRCVKSVQTQTYQNIEILLIDDGSTDHCSSMCDKYAEEDKRVHVFHKENGGLSDARNFGIEHARGEFITFIDSDDYVDADYVAYLYKMLKKYDTNMSICQHKVCYDNGSKKDYGKYGDVVLGNKECIQRMMYHDVIDTSAWAKLYRMDLFQNVRYPKGKLFEDIATTYALMLQCDQIAVGLESKYNYILRSDSIVYGSFNEKKLDLLEMTDQMAENVLQVYPDLKDAVLRRRVYARFSTLNQMLNVNGVEHEKKDIIVFIKKNGNKIFWNKKTPIRDKIAIILLRMGFGIYKKVWNLKMNH